MQIDATQTWRRQNLFWQQQAVRRDDHQVRCQGSDLLFNLPPSQCFWLQYRDLAAGREVFDRARSEPSAPAGRTVWLSQDGNDFVAGIGQPPQCGYGKIRLTRE